MCGLCVRWVRGKGVLLPAREQEVLSPGQKQFGSSWNHVAMQIAACTEKKQEPTQTLPLTSMVWTSPQHLAHHFSSSLRCG